ncbi:AAA family ATPase [Fibrella sp. HMF5335]|uniref:AAA family ATPase n=1 Tax=Fibrella rubiginis TaxID=2817060 RepID=A0A939GLT0_9BACT|nr:AAA family ATPase [Fibrella rubiginis]MBO0938762.1 AAA family ATPase [Fibrella rubiginis]
MTIDIPEQSLVLLIGATSSGKSTFARQHFRATEIISSDQCRAYVADDENDQSVTSDAFDLLHYWTALRLKRGKLTVIDATNVQHFARKSLLQLAREHHMNAVAIVFDLPDRLLIDRHHARPDRHFADQVISHQQRDLHKSLNGLHKEGFGHVFRLESAAAIAAVTVRRTKSVPMSSPENGPFDIIGDVHGCLTELRELLVKLGYFISKDPDGTERVAHPAGRNAFFVGDLVDRGPDSVGVLRLVMQMVTDNTALCVLGNHDDKLGRYLSGRKVTLSHGLSETVAQLNREPAEFQQQVKAFITSLVVYYIVDKGRLLVAHAGLKESLQGRNDGAVRAFCLYGDTNGQTDELGLPVRLNWAADYKGKATVVYGHTPVAEAQWVNNTIDIDTGCVFGGRLTALRYPERELVSVPARDLYAQPKRPFLDRHTA